MKTIRINDETHKKLTRIVGELTVRNSESKSYDDAINELITLWESSQT